MEINDEKNSVSGDKLQGNNFIEILSDESIHELEIL